MLLDYFQKHKLYGEAISSNIYIVPLVVAVLVPVAIYLLIRRRPALARYLTGASVLGYILCIFFSLLLVSRSQVLADYPQLTLSPLSFLLMFFKVISLVLIVLLSAQALGSWLLDRWTISLPRWLLSHAGLALGLFVFSLLLFLLGACDALYWYTVLPILIAPIVLRQRQLRDLLSRYLFSPLLPASGLAWYGYVAFAITALILFIGLAQSVTIYPKGFDALNFYANIPQLTAEGHGLVHGFRPHAWSLIQSLGYIAFDSPEVAHMLSAIGGLLVPIIVYYLGRKQLGFSPAQTLLAICAFVTIPAYTTQLSHELKIDLSLLYLQLVCLSLLLHHLTQGEDRRVLYLIAIILGFCLTIKMTSFLLIFGVLVAMWYREGKTGLPMAMFCFILSAILFLKLDRFSGLDYLLGGRYIYASLLVIIGVLVSLNHALADRHYIFRRIKQSILVVVIAGAVFTPWAIKNVVECDSPSLDCVFNGAPHSLRMTIKELKDNYQLSQGR